MVVRYRTVSKERCIVRMLDDWDQLQWWLMTYIDLMYTDGSIYQYRNRCR